MTFSEYIELYGFKFSDASVPEIKEVRAEASEHIYRTYENDLVSRKRPVESEQVKNWRRANKRFINHEIIDTAYCKLVRFHQLGERGYDYIPSHSVNEFQLLCIPSV